MSNFPNKPPKSFIDQAKILHDVYGLSISDYELAKTILTNMNYYCIKGYGLAFNVFDPNIGEIVDNKHKGKFINNINIEQIYKYFNLDLYFKSLLFNAIHIIEKNVRSVFACLFSLKYNLKSVIADNACQYFYQPSKALINFNGTIQDNYDKYIRQSADAVICWHVTKYNNDYPLWVLVEYFYLARLIWFLENIKDGNIKRDIRAHFGFVDYNEFISSLYTIKEVRNAISHFKRIVGTKLPLRNFIISNVDESINPYNNRNMFSFLLLIKKMLKSCDQTKWQDFKNKIVDFLKSNDEFLKALNAPDNWLELFTK